MSQLPPMVINGNLYDGLGPARLGDVIMHNFCVPADAAKLQAYLDRTYATPSGGAVRYRVLGDRVFLAVAQLGQVQTIEPSGPPKGRTQEIDVTLWILAQRDGQPFSAPRWIPAYMFVDSGPVLATGRDIWGFPKQLAKFDFPDKGEDPARPQAFDVQGWVVSPFAPDSETRWAPLIEIRPATASPPRREGVLQGLEDLARRTIERLSGDLLEAASHIQSAVGAGNMTMAFLKQMPDAADPYRACYQAIVEAQAVVTRHVGSGLTQADYDVRITSYASHPFHDELGVSTDWQSVGQGIWMQFDFQQNLGAVLWQASGT